MWSTRNQITNQAFFIYEGTHPGRSRRHGTEAAATAARRPRRNRAHVGRRRAAAAAATAAATTAASAATAGTAAAGAATADDLRPLRQDLGGGAGQGGAVRQQVSNTSTWPGSYLEMRFCTLFSESRTALLPRQEKGNLRKLFTKPLHQVTALPSSSPLNISQIRS